MGGHATADAWKGHETEEAAAPLEFRSDHLAAATPKLAAAPLGEKNLQ